ncbi:hypothetical protein [Streptomyces rimosus]|uniref:COG1470 family protein n=1 Tax=Streptomyces rimosus TaxID=1927 RepID=UPI0004C95857|nr:hypothetical protein [Streptomyces rimosus]
MPFRTHAVITGAALAITGTLLSQSAGAYAVSPDGARWAAAPAPAPGGSAPPSARDRPYFYLEGAPGTVLKDRLALTNPTGSAVTFRVGGVPAGPGRWIATASKEVRVPPRTRADVPFTVTVPGDAAPGDHPAVLVAEGDGRKAAVRVHLRVTGPALAALSVEDVAVERRGSAAVIRYVLVNRGNTTLTPRLAVHADGLFGPALRRAARALTVTLPPGRRMPLTEPWPDPPALDSVDVRLTVTAGGGARGTAGATYTAVPWGAAALLPAGLVAGAAVWRVRRRGRVGGSRTAASQAAAPQAVASRVEADA